MKLQLYKEGMTHDEEKNCIYWERNMLALLMASIVNKVSNDTAECGWYYDKDNNFDGFKRVISLFGGEITYHIPDDFDVGNLKEIQPNWDGHTTEKKYKRIMKVCGCKIEE